MSVIVVDPAESVPTPASTPEAESTERTIGRQEAEIEHLEEKVAEVETQAETTEQVAESALSQAVRAAETAWTTQAEFEKFKTEVMDLIAVALIESEEADDTETAANADTVEIVDDSPQTEAETVQQAPKQAGMLRRLLYGR
jgi:chromosome segregation ATPase